MGEILAGPVSHLEAGDRVRSRPPAIPGPEEWIRTGIPDGEAGGPSRGAVLWRGSGARPAGGKAGVVGCWVGRGLGG